MRRLTTDPEEGDQDGDDIYEMIEKINENFEDLEVTGRLIELTLAEAYEIVSATYDVDGVVETASVVWPDGATGTFTTTTKNATHLAVDAFTLTHVLDGVTKTITQTAVTRNGDGLVTVKPVLTVA